MATSPQSRPLAATEQSINALLASIRRTNDPLKRALAAGEALNLLASSSRSFKQLRDDAVRTLNESGMGYGAIAAELGITKGRVQQLLDSGIKTRRMGKVEVTASTEAAALRRRGASDDEVVEVVIPKLMEIRSAERYEPQDIAGMLNVPVSVVRSQWNQARKAKGAARAER